MIYRLRYRLANTLWQAAFREQHQGRSYSALTFARLAEWVRPRVRR